MEHFKKRDLCVLPRVNPGQPNREPPKIIFLKSPNYLIYISSEKLLSCENRTKKLMRHPLDHFVPTPSRVTLLKKLP